MLLGKGRKGSLLKFLAHTQAGVGAGQADPAALAVAGELLAAGADRAALPVVLDGVAGDVLQHLAQVQGAAQQMWVGQRRAVRDEGHAPPLGLRFQQAQHAVAQLRQVKGNVLQLHLAALQLGHVQHIVDQAEQEAGGGQDLLPARLLFFLIPDAAAADGDHAADAVDGGADVVAHAAQEAGLGGVGPLGLLGGVFQFHLVVQLPALLLGDVPEDEHGFRERPLLVELLGRDHRNIPAAIHILDVLRDIIPALHPLGQGGQVAKGRKILPAVFAEAVLVDILQHLGGRALGVGDDPQPIFRLDKFPGVAPDVQQNHRRVHAADGLDGA